MNNRSDAPNTRGGLYLRTVLALGLATLPSGPAMAQGEGVVVFAAASLRDAFTEIGDAFVKASSGKPPTFNFAASNELRMQLEHGAKADLFASANMKEMEAAAKAGLVEGKPASFVRNHLAVLVPASNPKKIQSASDLAKMGLKLALAHKSVPVGGYAIQMLEKMDRDPSYGADFLKRVVRNVVTYEQNVRQVVAKVLLGEVDACIAYRSDVTDFNSAKVSTLEVPPAFDVVATYPIALLKGAANPAKGKAFLDYVLGVEGQAILVKHRFEGVAK